MEAPIIRTCRFAAWASFGAGLALAAGAASARVEPSSALHAYIEARAAASSGALDRASQRYVAALAGAPDNQTIATQALVHAVNAGNWRLALEAAHILERHNAVPPDARLLLVAEAIRAHEWHAAGVGIDGVQRDQLFAFAAPVLRAWVALGQGQGDPLAALPADAGQGIGAAYAVEHRALLMAALGRPGAAEAVAHAADAAGTRGVRLRIAGAATLLRRGNRDGALTLLQGDNVPIAAARALVQAHRPLPGAIAAPDDGMAELLIRLSIDLNSQDLAGLGASFARLATWLAPDSSETWMVAAELLSAQGKASLAVPLLANVQTTDPFAAVVRDQRISILLAGNDKAAALAAALAATRGGGAATADWVRLGDVYSAMDRQTDAAEAYGRALALRRPADQAEWQLLLLQGGAFDQAGHWPEARTALQRAYQLAPDQPFVLNYLGYAELVRHENADEAERLIREAHRLAPDNNAIVDSLGWALYQSGRLPEAIALLEQAAHGEPSDVEINEHLGDAYYAAGRRLEARFAWRAAAVYADGAAATRLAAKIETGLTPQLAAR